MVDYKALRKKAQKEGKTENLTPDFQKFEKVGQEIVGEMVAKNPVDSTLSDGQYNQYLFRNEEGLIKFALGKAADSELEKTMVPGGYYAIKYEGQVDLAGGRKVNKFQVDCFGHRDEVEGEEGDPGPTEEGR